MNLTTLLLLVALLVVAWVFVRKRSNVAESEPAETTRQTKQDTTYHAVSIKYSDEACAAARDMTGRRFLATAAPRLPLPECDAETCDCRFVHHDDRRAGKDRRSPFAPASLPGGTGAFEQEQRDGKDRRHEDDYF